MENNDIKVSVCMTAFNVAPYLPEAIEGVLMQKTDFPFELVIGEDKGSDDSREICIQYKNKYPDKITLVFQEKNVGIIRNDISIIKQSKGKYIAWCDGDDYWVDENKLQKQFDILENNPKVSLVHTDWIDFFEATGEQKRVNIIQTQIEKEIGGKKHIEELMLETANPMRLSSAMFRKSYYLESLDDDQNMFLMGHVCDDYVLRIIMCPKGTFFHIPDATVMYRIRKESSSNTRSNEKFFRTSLSTFRFFAYVVHKYALSTQARDRICRGMLNGLLYYTFNHNLKDEAKSAVSYSAQSGYKLSLSQSMLYKGSVNHFYYYLFKPVILLYRKIRKIPV